MDNWSSESTIGDVFVEFGPLFMLYGKLTIGLYATLVTISYHLFIVHYLLPISYPSCPLLSLFLTYLALPPLLY